MEYTERGFRTATGFNSKYYGHITVRESSNAMGPHLWIFTSSSPIEGESKPDIQLSLEEAKNLRDDLEKMIEHLQNSWEV